MGLPAPVAEPRFDCYPVGMKTCIRCSAAKPEDAFSLRGNGTRRSTCKACSCEAERIRRETNPHAVRESQRRSYLKNRANIIARVTKWSKGNRERRREIANRYALKNLHKISAYAKAHPERLREGRRRREAVRKARKAFAGGTITKQDWCAVLTSTGGGCIYCGHTGRLVIDHFIPVAKGGRTERGNLVPACVRCNSRKSDRPPDQWVKKHFGESKLQQINEHLKN